jgi:hypothetical protein
MSTNLSDLYHALAKDKSNPNIHSAIGYNLIDLNIPSNMPYELKIGGINIVYTRFSDWGGLYKAIAHLNKSISLRPNNQKDYLYLALGYIGLT